MSETKNISSDPLEAMLVDVSALCLMAANKV
jgi:hypothetical protein